MTFRAADGSNSVASNWCRFVVVEPGRATSSGAAPRSGARWAALGAGSGLMERMGRRVGRNCRGANGKANWLAGARGRGTIATVNTPVWDDREWKPLPQLEGTVRADVCVIGLGGSGLAALAELTGLGGSAAGVDARAVGAVAAAPHGRLPPAGPR